MKNLILFFAILCNGLMASAQTSKGSIIVGGNVNFGTYKNTTMDPNNNPSNFERESKSSSVGFYPSIGYFIKDKLVVGISAGLNNNQTTYKSPYNGGLDEDIYKNSNTMINIFARKYFLNEKNFGFYTGLSAGAGPSKGSSTHRNTNSPETFNKSEGMAANVGLNFGVAYFPTSRIGLQAGIAGLGWSKNKGKSTDGNTSLESKYDISNFNLNVNSLALSLGICYIFGCKK